MPGRGRRTGMHARWLPGRCVAHMMGLWRVLSAGVVLVALAALVACSSVPKTASGVPASENQPSPAQFPRPVTPFDEPAEDAFHAQPEPSELAATPAGTVMRYRAIDPQAYYFFGVSAQAWQVAYASRDTFDKPQLNVATVLVPPDPEPVLLSYQVAYDALTRRCAPSYEILSGSMVEHIFVNKALRRGWIVVLPDYEGHEAQFLAGINSGHGVLDGIRATTAFLPDDLVGPDTPVGLWGYSGGAFASLWAAELAGRYAPEIRLAGVAAGGPPANLTGSARNIDGGLFAGLYFAAVIGLSRAYDTIDVDTLLNDEGRRMFDDLDASCIGQELAWVKDPLLSGYTFSHMHEYTTVDDLLAVPAVTEVTRVNRLGQNGFAAPLLYYHAFFDQLTPRAQARTLARRYCAQGVPVRFDYAFGEHVTAALTHASTAVAYLAKRFDGRAPGNDCDKLMADAPKPPPTQRLPSDPLRSSEGAPAR